MNKNILQSDVPKWPSDKAITIDFNNNLQQRFMRMKKYTNNIIGKAFLLIMFSLTLVFTSKAQIINENFAAKNGTSGWTTVAGSASGLTYAVNSTLTAANSTLSWSGTTQNIIGTKTYIGSWNNIGANNPGGFTYTYSTVAGVTSTATATLGLNSAATWGATAGSTGGVAVLSQSITGTITANASNAVAGSNLYNLTNTGTSLLITPIIANGVTQLTVYASTNVVGGSLAITYTNSAGSVGSTYVTSAVNTNNLVAPAAGLAQWSKLSFNVTGTLCFLLPGR